MRATFHIHQAIIRRRAQLASWDIGAHAYNASGDSNPTEFDVSGGPTYYAVAPAGYSYSGEQDTNYDTRKYNILSDAVAALPSSPSTPLVINIIGDWTGTTDSTLVTIANSIGTTSSNYLLIRAIGTARHDGVWDDTGTFYKLKLGPRCLRVLTYYATVDGLQFQKTSASGFGQQCVTLDPATGAAEVNLSNCIVKCDDNASFYETGILANAGADQNTNIWNCIVYNLDTATGNVAIRTEEDTGGLVSAYSSTLIGGHRGIYKTGSGATTAKNCYAEGAGAAYLSTGDSITQANCASSDATGSTGLQNIAHDTSTFTNVTAAAADYTLPAASPLINAGLATDGEASPLNFTTDIAGKTR